MLNQVVIVGRLTKTPEVKELEGDKRVSNITVAVPRSYKNAEGVYDTDFIDCTLWDGVAKNTAEYCKQGDIIGVKGNIKTENYEVDGETKKRTFIQADKITFLSSAKDKSDDKDQNSEMEV